MTKARRKNDRRGRHLPSVPAADYFEISPELKRIHADLSKLGYTLNQMVRPYLRTDGLLSVGFCWRNRPDQTSCTVRVTKRFNMDGGVR